MPDWVQAAMKGMAYSLLAVLGVLLVSFYSLIYGNFFNDFVIKWGRETPVIAADKSESPRLLLGYCMYYVPTYHIIRRGVGDGGVSFLCSFFCSVSYSFAN